MSSHGHVDMERIQREETRWRILRALDAGRPTPVSDTIIFRALCDINLPITMRDVRRELHYLVERQLVRITGGKDGYPMLAELTRIGIDLVEYTIPCESGISRPPKWD